ncbi:MAG: 50S ribosomal protein L9 [Candidatus Moraniibacteriota bacterium]
MKVILVKDVANVGKAGEIKEVKKGFAFNFLLPEGLAELATTGMVKSVEKSLEKRHAEKTAKLAELSASLKKIDGRMFTVTARAEGGKLFGSVTAEDIVAAAVADEVEIIEEMVQLERPIKAVGEYAVTVVAGQSKAVIRVSVVAE